MPHDQRMMTKPEQGCSGGQDSVASYRSSWPSATRLCWLLHRAQEVCLARVQSHLRPNHLFAVVVGSTGYSALKSFQIT
jgi:hypothetical protein